ncbi:MAG: DNA repair protein RecO [Myxococcota bacterium]
MAVRTQALLLRSVAFGESDLVVHLLTPATGRVTAIAKGARRSSRRFPGTLDFFNELRVELEPSRRPGAMARLELARLVRVFAALRVDPVRFALASYLLELLDRLAPEGGAIRDRAALFGFALEALKVLETRAPDLALRALLELRALAALGLCPELACCVRCRGPLDAPGPVSFHVADGGPLCAGCEASHDGALSVHRGTLRTLEQALHFDLGHLSRLGLSAEGQQEAHRLVQRFRRFHACGELRSERFLDTVLGLPPGSPRDPQRDSPRRA